MSDFDNKEIDMEEEIIIMTDEEGNEYCYIEEEIICIDDRRFAVLVPIEDCDCECECDCEHEHETDAVIAKIVTNEEGEDVYCNPTDEEFEEVLQIYNEREEE